VSLAGLFGLALWLAAAAQVGLLVVSVQVPARLNWRTELATLQPFNRKLMWVYGIFVVLTYLAFAVLTAALHGELLRGDRAAIGLAIFIGVYWLARIVVDLTYFDSRDWPQGRLMQLGHWALDGVFVFLTVTYLGLAAWRVWGGA
jgi:hypothetical protein